MGLLDRLRYIGRQWLWAEGLVTVDGKYATQVFTLPNGRAMKINSQQLIAAPFVQDANPIR